MGQQQAKQAMSSIEAERLKPGEYVSYGGRTFIVGRDSITRKNQYMDINTGQVYFSHSIYQEPVQNSYSVSNYLSRRCQRCGSHGKCNC